MNTYTKHACFIAVSVMLFGCGGSSDSPAPVIDDKTFSISSSTVTSATEDIQYSYQVTTNNGNAPTFTLTNSPEGMSISDSGLITWLPTEGVLSSGEVTLTVTNSDSTALSQVFTVAVQPVNDQLTINNEAENTVIDNGELFSLQILVTDVDDENNGEDISYQIASGPEGMTISSTGLIEWNASVSQSSTFNIDILVADGGEDNTTAVSYSFNMDVLYYQSINGRAVNYFTGDALASAELTIFAQGEELATTQSDTSGNFEFSVLDTLLSDGMVLSAALAQYSEHSIIISNTEVNQTQHIALLPSHVNTSFNPAVASNVEHNGNSIIDFSASSLTREDGQAIQGNVSAQLTIIDPSLDINLMPGEMITESNDEILPIESFGAINVVLADESGAPVNLAEDKSATIRIPVANNISSPPATIPLYYFDEQQGLWVEEGEASLVSLGGESFYQGEVTHFSTWNADRVYETSFIHGCVVDTENEPVANARIISTGRDYNGSASAISDVTGQFTVAARQNSEVLVSGSQGSQSRTLALYIGNSDYTINDCLVLSPATSTVKLTWGQNPRDLDTHFYGPSNLEGDTFHVYWSNRDEIVNGSAIYLDVDDTTSFGPEILTIPTFPFAGRYHYVVNKFSGSSDILESPTRVELNLGSQIRIFSPPQGEPTFNWHVFDFVVDENDNITVETINAWLNTTKPTSNTSSIANSPAGIQKKQKYYVK